ncbi:hypothetical protein HQQ81_18330 [Microbacteriaceae bacterium VKM Ac-2854]|nr:hypothetical protein [Microbacteriaceae bacterium VKM Ac-2854]
MDPSLAIIAVDDEVAVVGGNRYSLAGTVAAPPSPHRRIPWGRFALMRTLARTEIPRTQKQLAAESGVTQAAVSLELHRMAEAVRRTAGGWHSTDRRALWRRFLAEYPGPRGIVAHWYSVQPVIPQADAAASVVPGARLSGDVAADLLAPWRIPRRAVVYGTAGVDLSRLSFAESSAAEATLDLVVPTDPTVVATARAWDPSGRVVDPLIAAWDVLHSGGADAAEAAAQIQQSALRRSGS